jgi:hypothetical protein
MKITILVPESEFSEEQEKRRSALGEIVYSDSRREYPLVELIKLTQGSVILAPDPDNLGGFEKTKPRLKAMVEKTPINTVN